MSTFMERAVAGEWGDDATALSKAYRASFDEYKATGEFGGFLRHVGLTEQEDRRLGNLTSEKGLSRGDALVQIVAARAEQDAANARNRLHRRCGCRLLD